MTRPTKHIEMRINFSLKYKGMKKYIIAKKVQLKFYWFQFDLFREGIIWLMDTILIFRRILRFFLSSGYMFIRFLKFNQIKENKLQSKINTIWFYEYNIYHLSHLCSINLGINISMTLSLGIFKNDSNIVCRHDIYYL